MALAATSLTSCILLVSPPDEDGGAHCRFQGEETLCGACAREQCQPEIDLCCGDPSCDSALSALESCATNGDSSCELLAQSNTALATCLDTRCRGRCEPLTGISHTRCNEPLLAEGTACRCDYMPSSGANDHLCSKAVYPNTLCCAPTGWPGPALECACQPVGCTPTSGGCICGLVDYAPAASECTGTFCCAAADNCRCSDLPCESWQTQVARCTIAELGCAANEMPVESCSIRK